MVLTARNFTALLQTLSLTQGLLKPVPLLSGLSVDRKTLVGGSTLAGLMPPMGSSVDDNSDTGTSDPPRVASNSNDNDSSGDDNSDPCSWEPYDSPPLTNQSFPPFDKYKAIVYRYRQQQSVNLGSWFVHEAWMTPSLFTCAADNQISEVDIAHGWQSVEGARSVLERHWDTFITEEDFGYLESIGINTVRLPIGYWNLGPEFCQNTPFEDVAEVYRGSWPRVIRTINYAASHGIGVLVDLHGAPGSQNGQQHSGVSDGQTSMFGSDDYADQTIRVLTFLMKELAFVTNVVGIQLLNEPKYVDSLEDFYTQAIDDMRAVYSNSTSFPLYLHDGFNLKRFSNYVANRSDFVVQDHHSYFVFTPHDESEPASQHTSDVENDIADSLQGVSDRQRRNLVIDEFSCALTGDSLKDEDDPDEARKEFCTGQMEVYTNTTAGWAFWAYRKEECETDSGWCFTTAVGKSLPSSFFSYGVYPPPEPSQLPPMSELMEGFKQPTTGAKAPPSTAESYDQRYSAALRHARMSLARRDDSPGDKSQMKGYQDGFLTAKIFATYGLSKLGFTGQYIWDSVNSLGPVVIAPGTKEEYENGFVQGLADGEDTVATAVSARAVAL
ncbi:glycoside hydrolase [Irpex rosettiformis]|uniref:Glycoside hydrolase n=1 Tax=Irpex rosettiformis TaxID=378272 RepID=A0ACB8UHK6_9APHY|nr:glycoside hydrolase [Irpex rosettiformis]